MYPEPCSNRSSLDAPDAKRDDHAVSVKLPVKAGISGMPGPSASLRISAAGSNARLRLDFDLRLRRVARTALSMTDQDCFRLVKLTGRFTG
jgi:hypothetical protein